MIDLALIDVLRAHPKNARSRSKKQIKAIATSIKRFGFVSPVIATDDNIIVAGHTRVEAAKLAGLQEVPVVEAITLETEDAIAKNDWPTDRATRNQNDLYLFDPRAGHRQFEHCTALHE